MEIRSLNCSNCGAHLELPDAANWVTCNHCGAHLTVERTDDATTAKIAQLTQANEQLAQQVAELAQQNDADKIVPSFRHRGLRILSPYRSRHDLASEQPLPGAGIAVAMGIVACLFGMWNSNWAIVLGGFAVVMAGGFTLYLGRPIEHRPLRKRHRELELPPDAPTPDR